MSNPELPSPNPGAAGAGDRAAETILSPSPADPPGLAALAELDPATPLDAAALGKLLGRNPRTVQRAADRGELPAPFRLLGRHVWTAEAILKHLAKRQGDALAVASRRERARIEAQP